jgi:hypothetical protein
MIERKIGGRAKIIGSVDIYGSETTNKAMYDAMFAVRDLAMWHKGFTTEEEMAHCEEGDEKVSERYKLAREAWSRALELNKDECDNKNYWWGVEEDAVEILYSDKNLS